MSIQKRHVFNSLYFLDDEFAIDYIGRAARGNILLEYGITEESLDTLQIIRATEQPHAPEATKRASAAQGKYVLEGKRLLNFLE